MKTLPVLASLIAAAAAILALPLGFEATVSVIFATGLIGILVADYAHTIRPLPLQFAPAVLAVRRREPLRLAA